MNNYIIYYDTQKNKIKRMAINSRDIYPYASAHNKIPDDVILIAVICKKPCYQCEKTTWIKHSLYGLNGRDNKWVHSQRKFEIEWSRLLNNYEFEALMVNKPIE